MIIDNNKALDFFSTDISHYGDRFSDLKSYLQLPPDARRYYAKDFETFYNGVYVVTTKTDEYVSLELYGFDADVFTEAYEYAKTLGKEILVFASAYDAKQLVSECTITAVEDSNYEQFGVYGIPHNIPEIEHTCDIAPVTDEDVNVLINASPREWGALPFMLKRSKDIREHLHIAKKDGEYAGYISYSGLTNGYTIIDNVVVHDSFRRQGIAKQLVRYFCDEVMANGNKPFYGWCGSWQSAKLAEAMGFEKLTEPKSVWKISD